MQSLGIKQKCPNCRSPACESRLKYLSYSINLVQDESLPEDIEEELRDKLIQLMESNKKLNEELRNLRGKYQSKKLKYTEAKSKRDLYYDKSQELQKAAELTEAQIDTLEY